MRWRDLRDAGLAPRDPDGERHGPEPHGDRFALGDRASRSASSRLDEPPYPAYRFEGRNLAETRRIEIRIEDHYWDDSDAAVVFERRDTATGERRYLYHGNDGTSFPWNDTAQLDFLKADVRETVIQTILDVARRFPVIRFDAAMVLAKKHVERLWYPEPGARRGDPVAGRARDDEGARSTR